MSTQKRVHKCALAVWPLIVNTWKQLNVHQLMDFKHVVYIQWGWKGKCYFLNNVQLFWDPMDCSLPGPSVYGILQARILAWVAIPFSRGSSQPGDQTQVPRIGGRFFTIWAIREAIQYNTMQCNGLFNHKKEILIHVKNNKDYAKWMYCLCGFYLREMSRIISLQTEIKK